MLTRSRHRAPWALAIVFAAIFLHVGPSQTQAQDTVRDWNDTADPLQGSIGLNYGKIGGYGLAFRLPVQWWLYVQVAGGLWYTSDEKLHNYGVNLNYILRQDQKLRLFISAGGAYFYEDQKNSQDVWIEDSNWNYGGGVGVEVLQGKRWSWKLEADFIHYGSSGDVKITPQVGLFYYW